LHAPMFFRSPIFETVRDRNTQCHLPQTSN
jgi:hypothetical protein